MSDRKLLCFARGGAGDWEAICVDLDIAVQGTSFADVQAALNAAVLDYMNAAEQEEPTVRDRLMNRRAPWTVVARSVLGFFWNAFGTRNRADDGRYEHTFLMPCHG